MVRLIFLFLTFFGAAFLPNFILAQSDDAAVRVTVTMNPDGSKTVYQTNEASHQTIATTTDAKGKKQGKIVYLLDAQNRYESGDVFAPNGILRFKTQYRYDSAGRLTDESQLSKEGAVQHRIVYSYDEAGHQTGYAIYDGDGHLLGRTTPRQPSAGQSRRLP